MNLKNYISELKRRNVFKVSIAYIIVAWIIIQVASIALPAFDAPPFVLKTILFLMVIGFPLNLVFAWAYELTPEGIKKTKEVKLKESITPQTSSRLNKVITSSLSIAVIFLLFNQFKNSAIDVNTTNIDGILVSSIAVLPFSNTRPDPKTDYLGFALADQIIGDLTYLKEIIVRSSGSIRKYEKQSYDPVKAGDELNVNYVLNGSYLREADIIRLNIELIKVNTNEMIWREPIEVNYNNAFELQDIVAQKVVDGIKIQFSKKELSRIKKDIPDNPLAYEYYLRSLSYPRTNNGRKFAIEMLNKSIALDSNYAPTYDQLGVRIKELGQFGLLGSKETKRAENYHLKALSINGDLLSALANLAEIYTETARIENAVDITNQMLEINPNNASAHRSLGYSYRYAGMLDESIDEMKIAETLDPNTHTSIGLTYIANGEYDNAFKAFERQEPVPYTLGYQGYILFRQSKNEQAIEYFNRVISLEPEGLIAGWITGYKALIEDNINEGLKATRKIEQANISDAEAWYHFAENYALLGDIEGCIRTLRRAVDGGYFNYPFMLTDFFLDSVRDEPEFQKIIEQAKEKHLAFKKRFF